jgi:hypothetical protein
MICNKPASGNAISRHQLDTVSRRYRQKGEAMSSSTIAARVAGVAFAAALLFGPGVAWAQNPHFVGTPTASLTEDFALAVSFKEAGLGSNVQITYEVDATASGSCRCVTNSGTCPAAANKFPPTNVSGTGTFSSGKNGTISQTIETDAATCQQLSPSTCPGGQTNTLVSITYTDITITDETTPVGPVPTRPSTLSATDNSICQ